MTNAPLRAGRSGDDYLASLASVPPAADATPARRPCRLCHKRSRPVVPIGSSRWWDLCYRCAYSVSHLERYSAEPALDAWAERVEELLAASEGRWAS